MHKPWQKVGGGAESILVLPGAFGPEDKFVLYGFHTCSRRMPECSRNRSRVRAALRALGWMVAPARAGRKFRNIEVRVRRPGVTLLTYDGYFAGIPTE